MKKVLSFCLLWLTIGLLFGCTMSTSTSTTTASTTTTTTTTSTHYLRQDLESLLELFVLALNVLSPDALPGEFDIINVSNQTLLRADLTQGSPTTLITIAESPKRDVLRFLDLLDQCTNTEEDNPCSYETNDLKRHAKWSIVDGWIRLDYFQHETQIINLLPNHTYSYFAFEIKASQEKFEWNYLTVGPTATSLVECEDIQFISFDAQGNWEQINVSSTGQMMTRYDDASETMTQAMLIPHDTVYVVRSYRADGITHAGVFDNLGSLKSQWLQFWSDHMDFTLTTALPDSNAWRLNWNAFEVDGWDKVRFGDTALSSLYDNDTLVGDELDVFGNQFAARTTLTIQTIIPKDQLDAANLSLSSWGLSFQKVSLEDVEAALTVVPEDGMSWILELDMVFDWDDNLAVYSSLIQTSIDEAWLNSLQP
jgi:hypothetical protein